MQNLIFYMFLNLYTHHDYDVFTYFKICRIVGVNIYNQYVHNIQCIGNILVTHILLTHTYLHILNILILGTKRHEGREKNKKVHN